MRLAEDKDSWKARGVIRRDYRASFVLEPVGGSRKTRGGKPKKYVRSDHKHIYVEDFYEIPYHYSQTVHIYRRWVCPECGKKDRRRRGWRPVKVRKMTEREKNPWYIWPHTRGF